MKNQCIKYIALALTLNMNLFTTAIADDLTPRRMSLCEKITAALALAAGITPVGISTYNMTTPCPTLPEGFRPEAGITVQMARPSLKPHIPNFVYPKYNPETMEVPEYGRNLWGNCVLVTTYKQDKE